MTWLHLEISVSVESEGNASRFSVLCHFYRTEVEHILSEVGKCGDVSGIQNSEVSYMQIQYVK